MSILRELLAETEKNTVVGEGYAFEAINCESELFEVQEQYNEIVSDQEAITRLEEIHEGLESLLEVTEGSIEEGGLTPVTAQVLRISTEALVAPLGLTSPVLSQESFGAEGERLTSTRVSIEEEKGTIKKIWEAIQRAFETVRAKIVSWYNKIFDTAGKLNTKNQALKDAIIDLSGKKSEKETLDLSLSSLLSRGQSSSDISKNVNNLISEVSIFLSVNGGYKTADTILEVVSEVNTRHNDDFSTAVESYPKIKSAVTDMMKLSKTSGSGSVPKSMEAEGVQVTKHGLLPGNMALYSYMASDISKCGWKLGVADSDGAMKEKVKVKVLNQSELNAMASENGKLISAVADWKSGQDKVKDLKNKISAKGKEVSASVKDENTKAKTMAKNCFNYLKAAESFLNSPANQLTTLAVKTVSAQMSLMSTVIKAYK